MAYINPVVTDKGKMYNNGPRSLGRGHQSVPRSPFIIFFWWSELEKVTGESNVNRLGREEKKWAEVTGPRSPKWAEVTGPRSPWPRSHVPHTNYIW